MIELIDVGGPAVLPIVFCSIISLLIVIDRSWMSRGGNILQRKLLKGLDYLTTRIEDPSLGVFFITSFSKKMTDALIRMPLQKMRQASLSAIRKNKISLRDD